MVVDQKAQNMPHCLEAHSRKESVVKKMGGMGRSRRGGRPFGENTNSGRGFMTAYTRPSGGSHAGMKIKGRAARKNGTTNFKNRANKNWTGALDSGFKGL